MRLPAWLDVALEGGVLELERALKETRTLRRLLSADWRLHASSVADLTASLRARAVKVQNALERAHRRARVDEAAEAGAALARQVEAERDELLVAVTKLGGAPASLDTQLKRLHELASEEAHYGRSLLRFRRERAGMTVLVLGLAVAVPWSTWVVASMGGQLPTVISLEGLEAPAVWVVLLSLLGVVSACWARLLDWGWLGVRPPPLLGPTSLASAVGLSCAAAVTSFAAGNPLPVLVTLAGSAGLGALLVLSALWRDIFARGANVSQQLPLPSGRESPAEGVPAGNELAPVADHHAPPLPLELRHPRL